MRNMTVRAVLLFLILCISPSSGHSQGSEVAINHWVSVTRATFEDVRRKLRPTLSETERRILDETEFSVEPTIEFAGQATNRRGRIIKVSAGIALLMNALGESQVVAYRGNIKCMQTHTYLTIKDVFEGTDSERGRNWPIPAFARIEPACRGADRLIAGDADRIGASARIGLALVILHETAHQVLRHVDQKPADTQDGRLQQSRDNEDAADRWALRKALEIGEPLILAVPYLLVITATTLNDTTLEGESAASHPSGAGRALVILGDLEGELDKRGMTDEMKKSARETRRALEPILPH